MTITLLRPDGVPLTAQQHRQGLAALNGGGSGRQLGGRSGFRVGTPTNVLTATSTTWTLGPCAAMLDPGATTHQGMYGWANDSNVTGTVTAADATYARKDIVYIQVNDSSAGDGSGEITADVKYAEGTASASPVAPALGVPGRERSFLVGTISVPVAGGGSPTVQLNTARYVAAGGDLPVWSAAERDALVAYDGLSIIRMDLAGRPRFTWDGAVWRAPAMGFLGGSSNSGQTVTGTTQNTLVNTAVTVEANRRVRVTAKITADADTAGLYAAYQLYANGVALETTFVKRFSAVSLGESMEFSADYGSGAGGSVTFDIRGQVVVTSGTVKCQPFTARLSVRDEGNN